jgi:hypothetical protein
MLPAVAGCTPFAVVVLTSKKLKFVRKSIIKLSEATVVGIAERPPVFGFIWMTKGVYFIKFLLAFLLLLTKTGAVTE